MDRGHGLLVGLGFIFLAAVRGIWHIFRGSSEEDAGSSWGRQILGRQKRKLPEDVS
jgi:hypothetical protein